MDTAWAYTFFAVGVLAALYRLHVKGDVISTHMKQHFMGTVFLFFIMVVSKWLFYGLFCSTTSHRCIEEIWWGLTQDALGFQAILFVWVFYLNHQICSPQPQTNRAPYVALILSLLIVGWYGLAWALYGACHRFVSLDINYVWHIPFISLDWFPIATSIALSFFILVLFVFLFCDKERKGCSVRSAFRSIIVASGVVVSTQVATGMCRYTNNVLLKKHQESASAKIHNVYAGRTMHNPVNELIQVGFSELMRVMSYSFQKRMLPLVQRPIMDNATEHDMTMAQCLCSLEERIDDPRYPFYRTVDTSQAQHLYNVVVLVLESFEMPESDTFACKGDPYACLKDIWDDSVFFTQAFANAEASHEGETAIQLGLPVWGIVNGGFSGIYSRTNIKSHVHLLKEKGYTTHFVTTWLTWRNLFRLFGQRGLPMHLSPQGTRAYDTVDHYTMPTSIAGMDNIDSMLNEHLSVDELDPHIHAGGREKEEGISLYREHGRRFIHDEYAYKKLYRTLTKLPEPFYAVIHTYSSHTAFPLPKHAAPNRSLTHKERFYYSSQYAASELLKFFHKMKKHPRFKNTIFVICSDHTGGYANNVYDRFHIPIAFYAPHLLKPRRVHSPVCQMDIGATIVNLLHMKGHYTSCGINMLGRIPEDRCIFLPNWDGYLIFVYKNYIAKLKTNSICELYNIKEDKTRNIVNTCDDQTKASILHQFRVHYRTMADYAYGNRLAPP